MALGMPTPAAPAATRAPRSGGDSDSQAHTAADALAGQLTANAHELTLNNAQAIQNAQHQAQQGYLNQQAGFLNQAHANNMGLLNQSQYQNVNLGQMTNAESGRYVNQTWQNLQNFLAGRNQNVEGVWANQQDFYNRMAPLDFQTWALQRAGNLLDTQRDLDASRSQATARGAMSSRGYQAGRFNREEQSRVADRGFENQYNIRRLNADTTHESNRLSYQDALNQLQHQYATGLNTYTHGMSGVDIQNLMLQSLAQTYGLRGEQMAIQLAQSLAGNAHQASMNNLNHLAQVNMPPALQQAFQQLMMMGL